MSYEDQLSAAFASKLVELEARVDRHGAPRLDLDRTLTAVQEPRVQQPLAGPMRRRFSAQLGAATAGLFVAAAVIAAVMFVRPADGPGVDVAAELSSGAALSTDCEAFDRSEHNGNDTLVDWLPAQVCSIELTDRAPTSVGWGTSWGHQRSADVLTVSVSVFIGGEGMAEAYTLQLRDREGETPEFVSLVQTSTPYFRSPDPRVREVEIAPEAIAIDAWDPEAGRFSGHVLRSSLEPLLTFFVDESSDLERWEQGEAIPIVELRDSLASGDRARELEALHFLGGSGEGLVIRDERLAAIVDVVPQLLDLLDGGTQSDPKVAYTAAQLLGAVADPDHPQTLRHLVGPRSSQRSAEYSFADRKVLDPVSAFVPFDPSDSAQVDRVQENWRQALSVESDQLSRQGLSGVLSETLVQHPDLAGTYWEHATPCAQERWHEPCGVSLTLFCNGNALWNEGNVMQTAAWGVANERLVINRTSSILDEFLAERLKTTEQDRIVGLRQVTSHWC